MLTDSTLTGSYDRCPSNEKSPPWSSPPPWATAGRGIFPYTLLPGYRRLLRAVQGDRHHDFHQVGHPLCQAGQFHPL